MNELFLCYSRQNKTFAQKLDASLRVEGWDPWVDWDDQRQGETWQQTVQQGIAAADAFAFVISPDSVASAICLAQLEQAKELNKRIVPILHREAKGAPDPLPDLNWIFFRESDGFEAGLQNLIKTVQTDLSWVKAHTRLTLRATEWDHRNRSASFALRGDDLKDAEQRLNQREKEPPLSELQAEYIVASQQAAIRHQRMLIGTIAIALIIITILSCAAFLFFQDRQAKAALADVAEQEAGAAATARARADNLQATAAVEAFEAVGQAQAARTAAAEAQVAEAQAVTAKATAVAAGANAEQDLQAAKAAEGTAEALQAVAQSRQAEAEQGQAEALGAQQTAQAAEYLALQAQQTAQAGEATASAQQATAIAGEATAAALLTAAQAQQAAAEAKALEAAQAQAQAEAAALLAEKETKAAERAKAQAEAALAQAQAVLAAVQAQQATAIAQLSLAQDVMTETVLAAALTAQTKPIITNTLYSAGSVFDGVSIWVAQNDATEGLTSQIRPFDGAVLNTVSTESLVDITAGGGCLWASTRNGLEKFGCAASFAIATTTTGTLHYANNALWVVSGPQIHKLNPANGGLLDSFSTGLEGLRNDIAFDGSRFWLTDNNQYAVVDVAGNLTGPFPIPNPGQSQSGAFGPEPASIIFARGQIWIASGTRLLKLQPSNPNKPVILPLNSVGQIPQLHQLAFDGTFLWASTYNSNAFLKIRPEDGTVLVTLPFGAEVNDILTFDGANLWASPWSNNSTEASVLKMPVVIQPLQIDLSSSAPAAPDLISHGNYVWATNTIAKGLDKYHAATGKKELFVPLGAKPIQMIHTGTNLWVAAQGDNVFKLNEEGTQILATFKVTGTKWVAYDSNDADIWVVGSAGITRMEPDGSKRQLFLNNGSDIRNAFAASNDIWITYNDDTTKVDRLNNRGQIIQTHVINFDDFVPFEDLAQTTDNNLIWLARPSGRGYKVEVATGAIQHLQTFSSDEAQNLHGAWFVTFGSEIWGSAKNQVSKFDPTSADILMADVETCNLPGPLAYNANYQSLWVVCINNSVVRKLSGYQGVLNLSGLNLTSNESSLSGLTTPGGPLYLPLILKSRPVEDSTLNISPDFQSTATATPTTPPVEPGPSE